MSKTGYVFSPASQPETQVRELSSGSCSGLIGVSTLLFYPVQRVHLMDTSGNIISQPALISEDPSVSANQPICGLTARPVLELTEFWKVLGNVQRYAAYSDPNFTFLASEMAPVYVYQQNQIVPKTAFFTSRAG